MRKLIQAPLRLNVKAVASNSGKTRAGFICGGFLCLRYKATLFNIKLRWDDGLRLLLTYIISYDFFNPSEVDHVIQCASKERGSRRGQLNLQVQSLMIMWDGPWQGKPWKSESIWSEREALPTWSSCLFKESEAGGAKWTWRSMKWEGSV